MRLLIGWGSMIAVNSLGGVYVRLLSKTDRRYEEQQEKILLVSHQQTSRITPEDLSDHAQGQIASQSQREEAYAAGNGC